MLNRFKKHAAALAFAAALATCAAFTTLPAQSADLGGGCCADLEERIAELEATTARKGNRKMTVVISGQINKAIVYYDLGPDMKDWSVGDNSNSTSFLQVAGEARIGGSWKAGFVAQLGLGGYESRVTPGGIGYGHLEGDTNGLYTRKSFVYIEGDVGSFAVGHLSQATDEITNMNTSQAKIVSTPLGLEPLVGPGIGEVLDIFDGGRTDAVRYDSPVFYGFQLSASAAPGTFDSNGNSDGTIWDVALRYAKELVGFRVAAGVGYRDGVVIPNDEILGAINFGANVGDIKVISGSGSVMHIATGFFVTGAAGQVDVTDWSAGAPNLRGWALQSGVEEKWSPLGKTTVFGEYGRWDLGGVNPTYWGVGVVQGIDAAAMELYVNGRRYQTDGLLADDATVLMTGARVRF